MIRCIMFVMPVASDTHRHSHPAENAQDSGENASADLWEIKRALWLVSPASPCFFVCLLATVCGRRGRERDEMDDREGTISISVCDASGRKTA